MSTESEALSTAGDFQREYGSSHWYRDLPRESLCANGCGAFVGPVAVGAPRGVDPYRDCPVARETDKNAARWAQQNHLDVLYRSHSYDLWWRD